jgi:hypothetical protein
MKFRNYFLCAIIGILFPLITDAANVDPASALKVATGFYFERINQHQQVSYKAITVLNEKAEMIDGVTMLYVFNFQNGGWALVSADDRVIPVIAYSFEGTYNEENNTCCQHWWMDNMKKQIKWVIDENAAADLGVAEQWNHYLNSNESGLNICKAKDVTPLTLSTWDQGKFYNALCPLATGGPDGRAYVGCVATSMAQIMFYYRWPIQGLGSHGGVTFSNYYYRWNEMLNSLGNYNQGVAEICYHAGVAVNMNYSATGSAASSSDIPGALQNHFRYSSDCEFLLQLGYSTSTWNSMIRTNLDNKHPLIYSGSDASAGGHAWVCDGYQGTDYFHMNWGWSGNANGYYYLNNLSAGGYNFSDWQGAVFDIYPVTTSYPTYCTGTTNVNYIAGTIEDGSGPNNYQSNSNCTWLIAPADNIAGIKITWNAFNTEATNDKVMIYDGDNTGAPVLATFSGSSLPSLIQTTGDKALVVFTSNGSNNSNGWQLEYHSVYPIYCSGITTLTDPSGSITDGSGTNDYSYNQICRWHVQPVNVQSITISFSDFNVASDDWLKIYDENAGTELASYYGTSIPSQATYNTDKILVYFKTNNANNAPGWSLNYSSVPLGLEENPSVGKLSVYPNPASGKVFINVVPENKQDLIMRVYTIDGRVIYEKQYKDIDYTFTEEMDLSGFSKGIYILNISSKNGDINTKLVVE